MARRDGRTDLLDVQERIKLEARSFPNGCHVAEVEIDPETGQLVVDRYTVTDDFGNLINPMLAEGQVEGGISMGIGLALSEEMIFEEGTQLNPGFRDYMIPTTLDMPKIDVTFVDSFDLTGPYGAKGLGEPTLVPTAPAILNAIFDATGVRITSLPATPDKIRAGLAFIKGNR